MCAYGLIHEYLLITDEIKNFAQLYLTPMLMIHFVVRYEYIYCGAYFSFTLRKLVCEMGKVCFLFT